MEYFSAFALDGTRGFVGQVPDGTFDQTIPPEGMVYFRCSQESFASGGATVEEVATVIADRVRTQREAHINGGAMTPAGLADSNEVSRSNIAGAALAAVIAKGAGSSFSVTWTMADNSAVILNADQMIAMGLAVVQHVDGCHAHARNLKAQIESATTVGELLAIDVSAGWP